MPEAILPENLQPPQLPDRDGTSQCQRHLPSLDPATVNIDGHKLEDCLAFAQAYAQELTYFNLDNQANGDWGGFLPSADGKELSIQEIQQFLDKPDAFDDDCPHRRPHFLLFLVFLQLLGLTRQKINQLTRRHLDFYYQDYLALTKQAARPDRVNLFATLTADSAQTVLPAGTCLEAGQDSRGDDLFYLTDEDLVVNRAQVKRLSSVFVDKKVTGIREACEKTKANSLLAMFAIVYGEPTPGDPLPLYPENKTVDGDFLGKLAKLVGFVRNHLYLGFQDFRTLMRHKNRRIQSDADDWQIINGILEGIGQKVVDPAFTIPQDSRDFDGNLKKALNNQIPNFESLPGDIKSMEDLYRQSDKLTVQAFIKDSLKLPLDQFNTMMNKKMEIDNDWRIVNTLLESAGRAYHNNPAFCLENLLSPEFSQNLALALGTLDFSEFNNIGAIGNLDGFHTSLLQVEAYFHCRLEDFAALMNARAREQLGTNKPAPAEWESVYAILAKAYAEKVYAARRKQLDNIRPKPAAPATAQAQKDAVESMLRLVLGERDRAAGELAARLSDYWPRESSKDNTFKTIESVMAGGSADLDADGWAAVIDALEQAWRKREGTEPVAQQEEWLNLYASEDATAAQVDKVGDTPRWRTFGLGLGPLKGQAPAPLLGWSIASPVFCLSQGKRTVTLTLVFQADHYDRAKIEASLKTPPFQIEASTANGWLVPTTVTIASIAYPIPNPTASPTAAGQLPALCFTLGFDVSAPPIAALPDAESRWPLIRLLLRPSWQGTAYVMPYPLFQSLALERVLVQANVEGLSDLRMENDEGPLPSGKPFAPFGPNPSAGSGFLFVHPELVAKRLATLEAKLEWMKVPAANLTTYYKNYPKVETAFTAKLVMVDHHKAIDLVEAAALFDKADAKEACTIPFYPAKSDIPKTIAEKYKGYAYLPEFGPFSPKDPSSWPRYWRLELNAPDFQHDNYPSVSAAKSMAWATAIAASLKPKDPGPTPNADDYQVNPPYTPKLKSFSLTYECSVEIVMNPVKDEDKPKHYGSGAERMFYRQAFGFAEIQPEPDTGIYRFLPAYRHAGELYLGLEAVAAPQDLAMLFQLAEGSANPDLPPQAVEWSYLSGNRWVSLHDGGILADATGGLIETGIIKFRLPAAKPNTLLPAKLYWLRAAVAQHGDSVCDTVAIHTQAVSATWADRGNAPDHLNRPLPAQTIRNAAVPGIRSISQPYSSYGGKPGEQQDHFNTRVSERLRHKQRALTLWDYEHLLLEQFPSIYKAKCIPASSMEPSELGKVEVVVIPDLRNRQPFNPFEPKATAGQIAEITRFLECHAPPLAEIKVKNAHYVPVRVRFAVRFMPDRDPGFYTPRLNEDLNRFLSPWAYAESNELAIGGIIYANAIVDYLERRPYVDYVAGLKLFKDEDGLGFKLVPNDGGDTGYRVRTARPDGVLVADRQHEIDLITDTRFDDDKFTGIGYLKIELDFIIH